MSQGDLFGAPSPQLEGLKLDSAFLDAQAQASLVAGFTDFDFIPFAFHGWEGARRIAAFGSRYDFERRRLEPAAPFPKILRDLATRAAGFAGLAPTSITQALATEYRSGAGIGWHRDRPVYGRIIGLSFGAPCRLRFRRQQGSGWARQTVDLAPGSAYLLDGSARWDWEHSIAPVSALRYSVTFRTHRAAD